MLNSSEVDDLENALHEAFNDICMNTEPTSKQTNANATISKDDTIETVEIKPYVEQILVENVTQPSIIPLSIPCSVGSLPTPCAPVLDDLCCAPVSQAPFESLTPFNDQQLEEYYHNKLLIGLHEYIDDFNQTELKYTHSCEHPLNTLLQNYLHARLKLESIKQEINESKNSYITHEKHVWTLEPATYTQYGECQVNNIVF